MELHKHLLAGFVNLLFTRGGAWLEQRAMLSLLPVRIVRKDKNLSLAATP